MIPKSSGRRPAISSPRSQRPRLVHWMLADYHHSSGANASAHDRFPDQHLKISARVRCLQVSSSRSPKSHVCSTALPSLSAGARNLPSLAKLNRRPHQPQPDPSTSAASFRRRRPSREPRLLQGRQDFAHRKLLSRAGAVVRSFITEVTKGAF